MIAVYMPAEVGTRAWIKAVESEAEVPPEGRILGVGDGGKISWNSPEDEILFRETRAQMNRGLRQNSPRR